MSVSGDRRKAARLLVRIEHGAFSSRLLAAAPEPGVRTRVLGVLRWQAAIDHVLAPLLRRPLHRMDPEVRSALRMALYETSQLGVPAAVATDGAVHLVRGLGKSSASGLVNAVLRRAIPAWTTALDAAPPHLRLSHPQWLAERWSDRFGDEAATAIMTSGQQPAAPWAWFFDPRDRDGVATVLEPHPWCPGAWTAAEDVGPLMAAVARGLAYVQDPASQLVAHVAAGLVSDGGSCLDLCSAPGGKTALLLQLRPDLGAVACDIHPGRLQLARALVSRAGGRCRFVAADGTAPPLRPDTWDLVLLDAPCSGSGTLRRHPELRWRLQPAALDGLAATQRRLLAAASGLVAPGGVLLYSTCSIEPEENESIMDRLPESFVVQELAAVLPAAAPAIATTAGGRRLLPGPASDGFTLHALGRSG